MVRSGGAKGIRTPDLLHAMEARYQLRHSPEPCGVPRLADHPAKLIIERHAHRLVGSQLTGPGRELYNRGMVDGSFVDDVQ